MAEDRKREFVGLYSLHVTFDVEFASGLFRVEVLESEEGEKYGARCYQMVDGAWKVLPGETAWFGKDDVKSLGTQAVELLKARIATPQKEHSA